MPKSIRRIINEERFDILDLTADQYLAVLDAINQQHRRNYRADQRHHLHSDLHQVWTTLRSPSAIED